MRKKSVVKIKKNENDLILNYCLAFPMNARTLCMKYFMYMNSVSRLCLRLRDTALKF